MVLRFAQNHKNTIFSFFIRKANPHLELLEKNSEGENIFRLFFLSRARRLLRPCWARNDKYRLSMACTAICHCEEGIRPTKKIFLMCHQA
jgi:hypothetical protein